MLPVHLYGQMVDMDAILALARPRGIAVVEDNAHGLFARRNGRALGGFGELAALSDRAACGLRGLGVEPEQRVALLMHDGIGFAAAFLGAPSGREVSSSRRRG